MKVKELKDWLAQLPDSAVLEGRERHWGDFSQRFQLRVVFPMFHAEEEVEVKEEA